MLRRKPGTEVDSTPPCRPRSMRRSVKPVSRTCWKWMPRQLPRRPGEGRDLAVKALWSRSVARRCSSSSDRNSRVSAHWHSSRKRRRSRNDGDLRHRSGGCQAEGILFCSLTGRDPEGTSGTPSTSGQVVEARCTGTNKGGLEMEVAGHPAFMPAGQVALHHVPDLTVYVGQKMPCEVIELDRKPATGWC